MKLYFPTTSLNFNDIFATESISPKHYYTKRNYGTTRNFTTELSVSDNYLTLFSIPPLFSLVEETDSDFEEYPIIIELNDISLHTLKISEKIYISNETIYFHPDKVRFHFISENHLKQVLAKSRLVEETKLVFKYKDNFRLINKESLTRINLNNIDYPHPSEIRTDIEINNDKFFNKLKGLIYSILIKFDERRYIDSSISMKNEFSELLNKIDTKQNPYFEIAYDQLNSALKYYEKGLKLQTNEIFSYPQVVDKFSDGTIYLSKILENTQEMNLLNLIINYLVKYHESDNFLNRNEILNLLSYLSDIVNDSTKYKISFSEDINKINDRIIGKNYSFDFEDIRSTVLKNFSVFLMRANKLEELEIILNDNNITNAYLTFSFLGATRGFSSLSKLITQSVAENKELLEEIERQVSKIQKQIWEQDMFTTETLKNNLYGVELVTTPTIMKDQGELIETKIIDKIQKIRESRILKRFINRKKITLKKNVAVIFEEIEDDVFINFIKNDKEYIYILLRSKKNASSLEEQTNFKNNLKKLGYEASKISRINQGNFPVFFYFKVDTNNDDPLSLNDKSDLLEYLEFLTKK